MSEEVHRIDFGFVNAYLVREGEGYILIDTGMPQHWSRLEAELQEVGCLPDKLKLAIITHGDVDHVGSCARLQKEYQARVAIHPGDQAAVEIGAHVEREGRGIAGKIMVLLSKLVGGTGSFDTFQPDILLEDGQSLSEYGLAARVIHIPGHTKGSIAILTEDGQLFVGDTFSNQSRPGSAPFIQNFQELRDSTAQLKELKAKVVYPGHGNPFAFEQVQSIEA